MRAITFQTLPIIESSNCLIDFELAKEKCIQIILIKCSSISWKFLKPIFGAEIIKLSLKLYKI